MKSKYFAVFQSAIVLLVITRDAVLSQQGSLWRTYIDAGTKAYREERYVDAERRFKLALEEAGNDDSCLALALSKLALVYLKENNPNEAQRLSKRALAVSERGWGTESLEVADNLEGLAAGFLPTEKYVDIAALLNRVVAIRRAVLKSDDPTIAQALQDLGITEHLEEHYDAANHNYLQALAILEGAHTATRDHDVIGLLRNLALSYQKQNNYAEAESALTRALRLQEQSLWPEHSGAIEILRELANLHRHQGHYQEACAFLRRKKNTAQQIYGINDLHTVEAVDELSQAYIAQEMYAKAEGAYKEALQDLNSTSGSTRDMRLRLMSGLIGVYTMQGEYTAADHDLLECISIAEETAEREPSVLADYLNWRGSILLDEANYVDAEPVLKRALEIREQWVHRDAAEVAQSLNNLAKDYYYQGKYAQADPIYRRAIAIAEELQDKAPTDLGWYKKNYALLLYAQERKTEADTLFGQAMAIFAKAKDETAAAISAYELADLYRHQRRYEESEPLFASAVVMIEKVSGSRSHRLYTVLLKYASLLRETDRETDAIPLEKKAEEIKSTYARKR
jgi:tetratricopeptide (TPR) repeat protein